MAQWKKLVVSGSSISQLTNDLNYARNGVANQSITGSFSGNGSALTDVVANAVAFTNVTGKPTLISGSAQIAALGFATTGSNTFIGNQEIQGNVTFVSSSFISSNNQSGSIYISALNAGTVYLNSDGGEGNVNVGYNGWGGKLNVEGNVTIKRH